MQLGDNISTFQIGLLILHTMYTYKLRDYGVVYALMMAVCFGKGKNICILKLIKAAIIYLFIYFLNEAIIYVFVFPSRRKMGVL